MSSSSQFDISLVRLPSLWQTIARELWTVESALGGGGFRDVARRTHAFTSDGNKHEVTCLAQHGVERRTMYGLFLEEMRNRARLCLWAVNDILSQQDYIAGEAFTAADIMLGYTLLLATKYLPEPMPVAVAAYWDRLQQRPAYQNAFADAG